MNTTPAVEWTVTVTKHALIRWRQRCGPTDTDDEIRERLTRRVVEGIRDKHGLKRAKPRTVRRKLIKREPEELDRVTFGDLTMVYYRNGLDVTVITVY